MRQKTAKDDIIYAKKQSFRKKYLWLEGIFVFGCVVIGFLLRMYQLQLQDSSFVQGNVLFEKAMILKDNVIPYMNNNLAYAYTYWMSFLCSFFGNFAMNVLIAQVIMEEIAILFVYFALRNLNLKDGAQFLMVALQFLFYKGFVTDIIPECLLLFSIGFAGWVFSKYITYYKYPEQLLIPQYFKLFFVSILAAIPVYFNWIGCILPIFMIFGIMISPKKKKLLQSFFFLLGTIAGIALLFYLKAMGSGQMFYEIVMEYYQSQNSFTFDILFICYLGTIVIAMLVSKIISIIREIAVGHKEKQLPQKIKEKPVKENTDQKDIKQRSIEQKDVERKEVEQKDIVQKDIEQKDIDQKDIVRKDIVKKDTEQKHTEPKDLIQTDTELEGVKKKDTIKANAEEKFIQEERIEKKKIRFLENPLPVPKKHVKKEMDYAIIPPEDMMKFDFELEPGKEDFDI